MLWWGPVAERAGDADGNGATELDDILFVINNPGSG